MRSGKVVTLPGRNQPLAANWPASIAGLEDPTVLRRPGFFRLPDPKPPMRATILPD
jgi:hypothetical protein